MKRARILRENIRYYRPYYKLVAIAVMVTVAVITGSLMVGESVRATLEERVGERLGEARTLLFSRYGFFDASLAGKANLEGRAVLLSNGFIPHAGRLIPVMAWGMDDLDLPSGSARLNPALAAELALGEGEALVLRLPATGMIPSGSLFVTDNYTTSARLAFHGVQPVAEGGNLNLKNEQMLPYNVFMNRAELAELLEVDGKANLLLSPRLLDETGLAEAWSPSLSGIQVGEKDGFAEITSAHVFIREEAVEAICRVNPGANRLFSYLANELRTPGGSIPYSFVTAMDAYQGRALAEGDIILSDYSATRLRAKAGDRIRVAYYYTTDNLKTLYTDTLWARVAAIVPLAELVADSTLSADFPGLSDVEHCTDWDSDLPLDMAMITPEDEDYWEKYRTTPKAILSYAAIQKRWSNAYGSATAIRTPQSPVLEGFDAGMFGLQVIHPREQALEAARGGVDFASLFLSLGFFIIISALLLLLVPLSEMIFRRRGEFALLDALGYPGKRLVRQLWAEAAPVVLAASVAGVAAGILYTWAVLLLLGTLWQGATHTGGFILFPSLLTISVGWLAGTLLALLTVPVGIRQSLRAPKPSFRAKAVKRPLNRLWLWGVTVLTAALVVLNPGWLPAAGLFVAEGILLIAVASMWGNYWMKSRGTPSPLPLGEAKLAGAGLLANRKRVLLSFFTLTAGVFIVFSVGLNRQGFSDPAQLLSGTGGYTLWCESNIPIHHNIATAEGRKKLSLDGLPAGAVALQISRYGADDASCLNLNKVTQPTVLGIDMQAMANSGFRLRQTIYPGKTEAEVFDALQSSAGPVYPVLVDETVLQWTLMRKLGDTLRYESGGRTAYLQIAGTLENSVFQGNLLMDKRLFAEVWSEVAGSEVILFRVSEEEATATRLLVEQALNEYGVRVTSTAQRLQAFNSVTDTYLTSFLTLGGLGLLLGLASFIIVVRKGLASRKEEIRLYRSLGFTDARISGLLIAESRLVPLYAILAGAAGSIAGVSGGLEHISLYVWLQSALLAGALVISILLFIRQSVNKCLQN